MQNRPKNTEKTISNHSDPVFILNLTFYPRCSTLCLRGALLPTVFAQLFRSVLKHEAHFVSLLSLPNIFLKIFRPWGNLYPRFSCSAYFLQRCFGLRFEFRRYLIVFVNQMLKYWGLDLKYFDCRIKIRMPKVFFHEYSQRKTVSYAENVQ